MRLIRYHENKRGVFYCHAEEEVEDMYDFREWIFDNKLDGIDIPGQDHLCYRTKDVMGYLQMKGFQCVEIVEDYGEGEIVRQARGLSKLEIMD